jgi:2-polyprenyl-3-methyl-5-hydroxy-6-metoxy-1,4-benzoquinol methylase
MIEEILRRWRESTFDFRRIACPDDQLKDRFDEWVDYYRLKSAIAAVLKPATILEIGVRYGYSYAAFKDGYPQARYVGFDLDVDEFGGEAGALGWARKLGAGSGDEFLLGDSQKMTRLPGAGYDLIHIDGQQDGTGSYHDLSVAVSQGRYLLVDGYLWTRENCHSVSEFLLRYRDVIEWSLVIPGYAGELLIKVDPAFLERERRRLAGEGGGSEAVREDYTEAYYRNDCGGWETFARRRARRPEHARLRSLLDLALAGKPRRLLDLGCGRGEITYQAARAGVEVTAVDYSPAAIEIAKSCFEGEKSLWERVEWFCGNAAELQLEGEYDAVIAGDLVEHMAPAEVDRMYATVRQHLAPEGRFIVHTFPNVWFYRYDYARRRRQAMALGAFLPPEPRSRYEKLMHLNEQSPQGLRRQLARHFEHVELWLLQPEDPAGNLVRPMRRRELAACRDLYAVASRAPVERASLARVLSMPPLAAQDAARVRLRVLACPAHAQAGEEFAAVVEVENASPEPLVTWPPHPVSLCYHWTDPESGRCIVHDGMRSPLAPGVFSGGRQVLEMSVQAPAGAGEFRLDFALVQEGVRWFGEDESGRLAAVLVHVVA